MQSARELADDPQAVVVFSSKRRHPSCSRDWSSDVCSSDPEPSHPMIWMISACGAEAARQGMAARAGVLGTTGANHPDHWVGGLASPNLHAIVVLFARDVAERERCRGEHERYVAQCGGVEVLSSLDLEAIPPFDYAHEHFGYRDRLSQPVIEGTGMEPTPGSGPPIKPGEFFLGYPDEEGPAAALPQPEILSRNGSYVAYLRMQEHVGAFRDFLRAHVETPEQQELIAAKLMGRWRTGAPLVP